MPIENTKSGALARPPGVAPDPRLSASTLLNRLVARMRMRQLQLLVVSAELGSIQQAAAQIGIGQPSATKALAEMERLLGVALFERHARGVRPTAVCQELLAPLRHMLQSLHACAETLAAHADGAGGLLRLGAITGAIGGVLGQALPAFLARHPQLRVHLVEDTLPVLAARYADGLFDAMLVREPRPAVAASVFTPLRRDRLVIVGGAQHPLRRRRLLDPQQVLAYSWVLPPSDARSHEAFERFFGRLGARPASLPLMTRSQAMLLDYLRHSTALLITPYSFVQTFVEAGLLTLLPLAVDEPVPAIGLLCREAGVPRAVASLREFLLDWCREPAG